jgi:hypothetical protein
MVFVFTGRKSLGTWKVKADFLEVSRRADHALV